MRQLSDAGRASAFAQETSEVWLVLLTLSHADLAQPLRFVNNTAAVVSRGETYVGFPFEITLPGEDGEAFGQARIRIDNVDRAIVNTVRSLDSPLQVLIEVVLASQPDTVEASFDGLTLRSAEYDALVVTGVLRFEEVLSEPVSVQMTPARFPAMH